MTVPSEDQRDFLAHFSALGLESTLFPGVLWAQLAQGKPITPETIAAAQAIAGHTFTEKERVTLASSVGVIRRWGDQVRAEPLDYDAFLAIVVPVGESRAPAAKESDCGPTAAAPAPASNEQRSSIAFVGAPFSDAKVLALAHAYPRATNFDRLRPPAFP